MTPSKAAAAPRHSTDLPVPLDAAADALVRCAQEACRQHERVAKLAERRAHHTEMGEATEMCELVHRHLRERTSLYETSAAGGRGKHNDDFWHAANALWHASRDYARRHTSCDSAHATMLKHSSEKLGELQLENEFEASALLALRTAISGYRKLRPAAD